MCLPVISANYPKLLQQGKWWMAHPKHTPDRYEVWPILDLFPAMLVGSLCNFQEKKNRTNKFVATFCIYIKMVLDVMKSTMFKYINIPYVVRTCSQKTCSFFSSFFSFYIFTELFCLLQCSFFLYFILLFLHFMCAKISVCTR